MPRETWKINQFSGGINEHSDARDIASDESVTLQDCNVSKSGQVTNVGAVKTAQTTESTPLDIPELPDLSINPGYGLHYFSTDRTMVSPDAGFTVTLIESGSDALNAYGRVYAGGYDSWDMADRELWEPHSIINIYGRLVIAGAFATGSGTDYWIVNKDDTGEDIFDKMKVVVDTYTSPFAMSAAEGGGDWLVSRLMRINKDATGVDTSTMVVEYHLSYNWTPGSSNVSIIIPTHADWATWPNNTPFQDHDFAFGSAAAARQIRCVINPPESAGTYVYKMQVYNSTDSETITRTVTTTDIVIADLINDLKDGLTGLTGGGNGNISGGFTTDEGESIAVTDYSTTGFTLTAATSEVDFFGFSIWMDSAQVGESGDNHTVFAGATGAVSIHHESTNAWERLLDNAGANIDLSSSTDSTSAFYSDSGIMRICNSNFEEAGQNAVWYGYINRGSMLNGRLSLIGWKASDYEIAGNALWIRAGVGAITSGDTDDNITDCVEVYLSFGTESTHEMAWEGNYKFHITAYFDDEEQETLPIQTLNSGNAVNSATPLKLTVSSNIRATRNDGTLIYPERMTGFRVYFSKESEGYGIYYALCDLDFNNGIRRYDGGSTTSWSNAGTYSAKAESVVFEGEQSIHTFESINGYRNDDDDLTISGWKTSAITNRRCFVGNVLQGGIIYGDRMIVSPYNKFDVFPSSNVLNVVVNDGESIVKLEAYADRILQFKQSNMYIINVSEVDAEYVEDTYKYRGVTHPNHTCWTSHGIAWINKYGAYLYDGEDVRALTEKIDTGRVISDSSWTSFVSNNTVIGYDAKSDQIILKKSSVASDTGETETYNYDFTQNAWTSTVYRFKDALNYSNFITRKDGTLIVMLNAAIDDGIPDIV